MEHDPEGWVGQVSRSGVASGGSCRLQVAASTLPSARLWATARAFLKTNTAEGAWQFDAEQDGLAALNTHAPDELTISCGRASGVESDRAYLALD